MMAEERSWKTGRDSRRNFAVPAEGDTGEAKVGQG